MSLLVAEDFPFQSRTAFVGCESADRQLTIKNVSLTDKTGLLAGIKQPVTLLLDGDKAASSYETALFNREDPEKIIDEPEIENLISHLVLQRLNENKDSADSSLCQIQIIDFNVDGKRAFNPMGLFGGEIIIRFCQTLVKKDFLRNCSGKFLNDNVTLKEAGALWAHVISHCVNKPFVFAASFYDATYTFLCDKEKISRINKLNWGEKNILSALFRIFGTSQPVAREIMAMNYRQETSSHVEKKISLFLQQEFKHLSGSLELAAQKNRINLVFLLPLFPLSLKQIKFNKKLNLAIVDNNFIVQRLGFGLKFLEGDSQQNWFPIAAAGIERSLTPAGNLFNKMANRRFRWHGPVSYIAKDDGKNSS